jgi:hypothetical protein
LTKLNIPANDGGGELDPHGADGNGELLPKLLVPTLLTELVSSLGNPIGGLVFSTAFGALQQIHEWTVRPPLLNSSFFLSPSPARNSLPSTNSASARARMAQTHPHYARCVPFHSFV